ncbi:hypothetical protein [Streptomyces sp. PSAA01]|uniref:hypothetical protein n=1 Tax=Streptomyces sp. PSAA01 TaxID=2912762 RepID=UPI001F308F8C|nr:hypothetical protein [Streptomyces sp. PSAA01]MCG0286112.1 hypothetical protein [Streptomyces sp. PSAA01]
MIEQKDPKCTIKLSTPNLGHEVSDGFRDLLKILSRQFAVRSLASSQFPRTVRQALNGTTQEHLPSGSKALKDVRQQVVPLCNERETSLDSVQALQKLRLILRVVKI